MTSEGTGSAFIYSKGLLERALLRLHELGLVELESREESLWNCDIKYCIFPDDIESSLKEIHNLERMQRKMIYKISTEFCEREILLVTTMILMCEK